MNRTNQFLFLAQANFFSHLSDESRRALADICILREIKKRDMLFAEGDHGHSMYLLDRGDIQLFKTTPEGASVVIKVIQPGEVFAEVTLFEQDRFPVSAIALSDSAVFQFPRRDVHRLLAREDFRNDFIAMLMRKQRYLAERIYDLSACDVEARFYGFLEERFGTQKSFTMTLSKKDVAAAIGTSPETLSRLIQRLVEQGILEWDGKTVKRLKTPEAAR